DFHVTGVQTCALPISRSLVCWRRNPGAIAFFAAILTFAMIVWARVSVVLFALASTTEFPTVRGMIGQIVSLQNLEFLGLWTAVRSEERRVGRGAGSRR